MLPTEAFAVGGRGGHLVEQQQFPSKPATTEALKIRPEGPPTVKHNGSNLQPLSPQSAAVGKVSQGPNHPSTAEHCQCLLAAATALPLP